MSGAAENRAALAATDVGNAERLADVAGDELRAVIGDGWVAWDGTRWARDNSENTTAIAWAKRTARAIEDECDALRSQGADDRARAARYQHALRSQAKPRLDAMLHLARGLLKIDEDDLDGQPYFLNTEAGVVDLPSGALGEHDREDLISKLAGATWVRGANAPAWDEFLETVLPDPELRAYVQRLVGYWLTGETGEQQFYVLLGSGANGKSVFLRVLKHVFGEYAAEASPETFMVSRRAGGDTRSDLVRLRGFRLITTSETTEGLRFDDRLLKELTGGEKITARQLYRDEVTYQPKFKLVISCNALPGFDGSDYAMRRRLRVIPFGVQIPDDAQDPKLYDRLIAEAPGILAWAVAGAVEWYERGGAGSCPAVDAASAEIADDMDPVGMFLADECRRDPSARTTAAALADAYHRWARENRRPELNPKRFGDALRRHGLANGRARIDGKAQRVWRGVEIVAAALPETGSVADQDGVL